MRNLLLAVATGALLVAAVPASAQVYMGADPGGAGVQVGPFGFGVGPRYGYDRWRGDELRLWRRLSPCQGAHRNGRRSGDHQDAPLLSLSRTQANDKLANKRAWSREAPGATRSHSPVIARSRGETKQQRDAFDADVRPRTTFARSMELGSLSLSAKPTIFRRGKGRRSDWPTKDSPTSSCACGLRLEARSGSDQRRSANRSS